MANTSGISITNCYNSGKVTVQGYGWTTTYGIRVAGGIIGLAEGHQIRTITISNCYNDSNFELLYSTTKALAYRSKGAMVGKQSGTENIYFNSCYYNNSKEKAATWNDNTFAGIFGRSNLFDNSSNFVGWSTAVWSFSTSSAPKLNWMLD